MSMKRALILLFCAAMLGGCGGDFSDLDAFMAEAKAKPKGKIPPIPTFTPYSSFVYSAQSMRAPFDIPLTTKEISRIGAGTDVKPDLLRAREFLERFNIEAMTMVGSLMQKGTLWALLNLGEGEGGVYSVRVGNYVGKNHGRIVATDETSVEIREIVPSGTGGWIERPRTIKLTEK
jgi:type IV pilus assembly protein PilP